MKRKKGFTLSELAISLAVLSIIAVGVMTLTASTMNNMYLKQMAYMYRNETQNLLTCFVSSNITYDSTKKELRLDDFYNKLEYYYIDDKQQQEDEGVEIVTGSFNPNTDVRYEKSNGRITLKLSYDSLLNFSPTATNYTIYITIRFTPNSSGVETCTCKVYLDIFKGKDLENPVYSQGEYIEENKIVEVDNPWYIKEVEVL